MMVKQVVRGFLLGAVGCMMTSTVVLAADAVPVAEQGSCDPVRNAFIQMADSASFTMNKITSGQPSSFKMIGKADGVFLDEGRGLQKVKNRDEFSETTRQALALSQFDSCKMARTDKVGGRTLVVYTYQVMPPNNGEARRETMWVGQDDSRLYRVEDAQKNGMLVTYP